MIRKEWIGKKIKIISASNKSLEKIQGIIIDETKYLFHVETECGVKKIPKKGTIFQMTDIKNGKQKINVKGDLLVASPEERIKLKVD